MQDITLVTVLLRLAGTSPTDDAADALAIAICHHHTAKKKQQTKTTK
jgi:Holliday junction resolvasome RuvABC endonuclease subunit